LDIFEAYTNLKNKKVSSVELTQECLKAAKETDNGYYISLLEDQSLHFAKEADKNLSKAKSFLHGIPYSLKDLFVTQDIRTTAGSKILYNYIPPYDGYVSSQLKKAGAVLLGKVGCDQFGMGGTNENTPYGKTYLPGYPDLIAGGSSGASAAAVKEGASFFSMGTDTGGSSRLPANFCGLVGYKPTYGRISRYGQIAFGSSLDQAAPIANSVLDMGCIIEELTDKDPRDTTQAPLGRIKVADELSKIKPGYLKGKTIGYIPEFVDGCDKEVKESLHKALDTFKSLGAKLVEVSLPHSKYCVSVYYIIATSEASANLARFDGIHFGHRSKDKAATLEETYINSRTEGFGSEVKRRILLGTFSLSSGYQDAYFAKACKVRRLIANDFAEAFKSCDVVFNPVCSSPAFKRGESDKDPFKIYMNDMYTIPVNLAGLPAIAQPFGLGAGNLPTGFQLIGKTFEDEELLKISRAFELGAK
jgi:aspartyl-tRNA(Asn)/glutamyl-tRNA(Gln) amidotransferase subunit A